MSPNDAATVEFIMNLDPEDRIPTLLAILNGQLKDMDAGEVARVKRDIDRTFEGQPRPEVVVQAVELIDGHIALREIANGEEWR